MSEIRPPRDVERPLIPPIEPVTPGQPNKKFKDGESKPVPEKIKLREGERKRIWVPADSGTYNKSGRMDGEWKMLTQAEAEELGLKWEE